MTQNFLFERIEEHEVDLSESAIRVAVASDGFDRIQRIQIIGHIFGTCR